MGGDVNLVAQEFIDHLRQVVLGSIGKLVTVFCNLHQESGLAIARRQPEQSPSCMPF
jgi:hypothetical protein